MTEPLWITHIRHEGRIRSSFEEWMRSHERQHVEALHRALEIGDLHAAQISLGKQKVISDLLHEISSYDREEKQRVALEENVNGKPATTKGD